MTRQVKARARQKAQSAEETATLRVHGVRRDDVALLEASPGMWNERFRARWIMVRAEPKALFRMMDGLRARGLETWWPNTRREASACLVMQAILPGAFFLRIPGASSPAAALEEAFGHLRALSLTGALVDVREAKVVVTDAEVDRFRAALDGKRRVDTATAPRIKPGDRVRVPDGALVGLEFEVQASEGDAVVSAALLEMFRSASRVTVSARMLEVLG